MPRAAARHRLGGWSWIFHAQVRLDQHPCIVDELVSLGVVEAQHGEVGIAVVLVIAYLLLNLIVVCVGFYHVLLDPSVISTIRVSELR